MNIKKMTETINLICYDCVYWKVLSPGCEAFPDGIPDVILRTNKHDKPLKEQENAMVFERILGNED